MSILTRVKGHLEAAGLLAGYRVLYFRWSDEQVNGNEPFILFRESGTSGADDFCVQYPDVRILLVTNPDKARDGDTRMLDILRHFRTTYKTASGDIKGFDPIGPKIGPIYLENDRPLFELNIRCLVDDH